LKVDAPADRSPRRGERAEQLLIIPSHISAATLATRAPQPSAEEWSIVIPSTPDETKSIGHVLPNALEPHIAISHRQALDILSRPLGLSEDHGGGTPGSVVWILTRGLSAYREVRPANPIDQLWPGITPAAALEKLLSNPSEPSVATTA